MFVLWIGPKKTFESKARRGEELQFAHGFQFLEVSLLKEIYSVLIPEVPTLAASSLTQPRRAAELFTNVPPSVC
jgi:hypothetical protein